MTEPLPDIVGQEDPPDETQERVDRQELLDQALSMDMPRQIPTDEDKEYRDVKKPKTQSTILKNAAETNKKSITEKQRANLVRAREAKAAKRRQAAETGRNFAEGTPTPDLLIEMRKMQEEHATRIEKAMQAKLDDMQKLLAREAPLQSSQIVPPPSQFKREPVPIAATNADYKPMIRHDNAESIPLSNPRFPAPQSLADKEKEKARRFRENFRDVFSHYEFDTPQVLERAQSSAPPSTKKVIYF